MPGGGNDAPQTRSEEEESSYDEQLQIALAMSEQDMMAKSRDDRNEDEELERILKLSMTEK